jgi:hypothetical protein
MAKPCLWSLDEALTEDQVRNLYHTRFGREPDFCERDALENRWLLGWFTWRESRETQKWTAKLEAAMRQPRLL